MQIKYWLKNEKQKYEKYQSVEILISYTKKQL